MFAVTGKSDPRPWNFLHTAGGGSAVTIASVCACVQTAAALGLAPQSQWGVRRVRRRAERLEANPSNLIRVMPAEGAEMHLPRPTPLTSDLPDTAADILARLRARGPR